MKYVIFIFTILMSFQLQAGNPHDKFLKATRITEKPIIDGNLNDNCWKNLPIADKYITNQPNFGNQPHVPCEARIGYDDEAIYICAKLTEANPGDIAQELCQRDNIGRADLFAISIDTYDDDQNAFRFMVTASDSQIDGKYNPSTDDNGNNITWDWKWDGVWTSKVKIVNDGWVLEMKIPYQALRFPKKDIQNWGIQFQNYTQRFQEEATWSPLDPKINGTINQYGELTGLENIKPPLRLSFSPYLANTVLVQPKDYDAKKYFRFGNDYDATNRLNGGMDLKYGINESFTLDMTLIPDFGQVQSDNKVRNLSPFEVRFEERRPFFTEGTELFSKGNIFYSRRIGGRPDKYYDVNYELTKDEQIKQNPSEVQLYNATKISGRTSSKLGIGFLNAVTAPSFATIENINSGETRKFQTGFLTNYNMIVLDQPLKNNSAISFTNTNVKRFDPKNLATNANVSALNMRFRNKANKYEVSAQGRLSDVYSKESQSIGYTYNFSVGKIAGNHTYNYSHDVQSDKYNPNDLGIFTGNNAQSHNLNYNYETFKPIGRLLNLNLWAGSSYTQRFDSKAFQEVSGNFGYWMRFKNFWSSNAWTYFKPIAGYDYFEPRVDGLKFKDEANINIGINLNSDDRKKFTIGGGPRMNFSKFENSYRYGFWTWPQWQLSDRLKIGYVGGFTNYKNNYGFATLVDNGNRPIFGSRNIQNVENQFNLNYKFSTKMNVTVRFRHYWNKINYNQFFDLKADGSLAKSDYSKKIDETVNFFNMDLIYTWQFAPGSFLNFIWKNNAYTGDDDPNYQSYGSNLNRTLQTGKNQNLALKVIYFIDYQSVKNGFRKS